jgi:small subunit ribosomal protein S20
MATHKSAAKRHRQSLKKKARNRFAKATIRTTSKSALEAAQSGNKEEAKTALKIATRSIAKASVHGTLHKKTAARKISRLTKRVNKLAAAA